MAAEALILLRPDLKRTNADAATTAWSPPRRRYRLHLACMGRHLCSDFDEVAALRLEVEGPRAMIAARRRRIPTIRDEAGVHRVDSFTAVLEEADVKHIGVFWIGEVAALAREIVEHEDHAIIVAHHDQTAATEARQCRPK